MPLSRTGIQNFYEQVRVHGLSRNFQFRILRFGRDEYDREIVGNDAIVYMTTASVPARQISNKQLPYMGLDFNLPGAAKYPGSDSWPVTFRLPQDYVIRNVLEKWTFDIFSDETSRGDYHIPCPDSTLEIGLLNNRGAVTRQYRLIGVYCTKVGDIQYDITGDGDPVTFQASLAYQYWRPVTPDSALVGGSRGGEDRITPIYDAYTNRANSEERC